jgi:cell division protein FtsN
VESQNPPGPPRRTPSDPEQAWISPRLRAKLDDEGPETPREGPPAWIGIVLAVLVIVGGAGLFVAMRTGAAKQKADAERLAHEKQVAAQADSLANVAKLDSMRIANRLADSLAHVGKPVAKTPAPKAPTPTASAPKPSAGASAAAPKTAPPAEPVAAKPAEKGPFGLDVGTFLDEDRAKAELEKLSTATGLKGTVITREDVFHVVLGSFPTRSAANKRAEALVAKSLVSQAESISLAP